MSTSATTSILTEIQNELIKANNYMHLIKLELIEIKKLTSKDGLFDTTVKESSIVLKELCKQCDIPFDELDDFTISEYAPQRNLQLTQDATQLDSFF